MSLIAGLTKDYEGYVDLDPDSSNTTSDASLNLYIDNTNPAANDNNPGTQAAPLLTIGGAEAILSTSYRRQVNLRFGLGVYAMPASLFLGGGAAGDRASGVSWLGTPVDQLGQRAVTAGSTTSNIIDTAVSASFRTSAVASITAASGAAQARTMTVAGLNNLTAADVGKFFFFGLCTNPGNNGYFKMATFVSPTSATFFNAQAVVEATSIIYWQDSWYGSWLRFNQPSRINCVAVASLVNNDNFSVTNTSSSVQTIFEYKVNGGFTPVAGRVTIDVSALSDPSSTGVAVATATAIQLATGYVCTPAVAVISLVSALASSGALPPNLTETVANAGFTVNALGAQEYRQINSHGVAATSTLTVAGVVGAGDTVVLNDGTNAPTTLTWNVDIVIGVDNNANAANLVTAINALAPTACRIRATNTAGTAVVKLTNMIMGSAGNTVSPTKTGGWTPTIVTFATAATGVGAPTTTFTVGIGVGAVIFSFTPAVGDLFVIEKPGTVIQYSGTVQANQIGQQSQLGLKNIKLQAAASTNTAVFSGFKLATRATEIDMNGGSLTFQASCFVGFIANGWNNDPTNPFGTAGGSGAGAMFFHSGTLLFQNFSNFSGGALAASAELRFTSQAAGNPVLYGRRTTVNVLTRSQITTLASLNLDGTLLSTDIAIVQVDRDCYAEPGTSILKNSSGYGIYFGRDSYGAIAALSGDGNAKAGICVDRKSGAVIDFSGASTTISGTPGDTEFGHETVPLIESYATIRTVDGTGTKGFQDTHLNRIDA